MRKHAAVGEFLMPDDPDLRVLLTSAPASSYRCLAKRAEHRRPTESVADTRHLRIVKDVHAHAISSIPPGNA
jgi:hypothetical protein